MKLLIFALGVFLGFVLGLNVVYRAEPTPQERFEAWRAGLREAEGVDSV